VSTTWKKHIENLASTGHVVRVAPFRWVQDGNSYAGAPLGRQLCWFPWS